MKSVRAIAKLLATVTFRQAIWPELNGFYGVIQARDIGHDSRLNSSDIARIRELPHKGPPPLLKAGDIVLQSRGTSFRAATVTTREPPLVASGSVYALRPDASIVDPEYLALYFNLPSIQKALRQIATGTPVPNIRRDALESFAIILPPLAQQRLIAEVGDEIHRAFEIEKRLRDLRLKQLHALIAGGEKKAGDVGASPASKRSDRCPKRRQAIS